MHDSYKRTNQPHGGIASPASGGRAPYRDAEPAEHRGPCWAAAIGRHSRGREHDIDCEVIIREALADLVEHPENCRCVRRAGSAAVTGGAVRVDAEQVGAALPRDRVLAEAGGPRQFGDQLIVERDSGAFGGDPTAPSVATRRTRWATVRPVTKYVLPGLMEGFGWFAA